jgi:hypothetical protein
MFRPNIVPNILLNKREELLPLLLLAIQHHPDAQTRDQLLNILFNLMKKPDADQRKVILKGFKKIAKYLGHDKVEAELLPQLWEQIDHKVTRVLTVIKFVLSSLAPCVGGRRSIYLVSEKRAKPFRFDQSFGFDSLSNPIFRRFVIVSYFK